MRRGKNGLYCRYIKRALDLFLALLLCIPSIPILGICYVGIKIETRGPAFFLQERPGKDGKIFLLYKLRTMIEETERNGQPLSDMERITKTGWVIRACSFDELPQIWNVLKGDMSVVGPRPDLKRETELYRGDEGLKLNPHSAELCRELAWLFELKLGTDLDAAGATYREKWREIVKDVERRGAWPEIRMDGAVVGEVRRGYGIDDVADPQFSAVYWALRGLPYATEAHDRVFLRQILQQALVIYAKRH